MMRPVGAFIFGLLGDKFGRRIPLMADIVFYSVMELCTAFAPNFTIFLALRALFGIGMGGEWGLGASLAMESLPTEARGLFSGVLQQGYAVGYLLAALVYWIVFPHFGWRGLFVAGALPAFLVIYIRARVPESPVWQREHTDKKPKLKMSIFVRQHGALFVYAALLMTAFNYISGKTAWLRRQREVDDRNRLCDWCNLWGDGGRVFLAILGPPAFDYLVSDMRDVLDSALDLCAWDGSSRRRRFLDAVHGARRVGRCAGALERTFAAGFSRNLSRPCLSTWKFRRSVCRAATSVAGGTFPFRKRSTELRADHGAGGSDRFSGDNFSRGDWPRRARQRILIAFERGGRETRTFARRWRDRSVRNMINAGTVALLHDCFRNPVR